MRAAEVAKAVTIFVSDRGTALVRHAQPMPANDNVPGTITLDSRPRFLLLVLVCAVILDLADYVALNGPDNAIMLPQM